jgi:hypothetical protein
MPRITLTATEDLPTMFTAIAQPEPRRPAGSPGEPVDVRDEHGLRIWTPILGPSCVLMARVLLAEPGRTWHIGDLAGHLGLGTRYAQRCVQRLAQFGWLDATADGGHVTYQVLTACSLSPKHLERVHPELAARYARYSGLADTRGQSR